MRRVIYHIIGLLALWSCSDIANDIPKPVGKATVTFMVSPNGLGDNGYNDAAAEGFFAFGDETGTRLRLLLPESETDAEQMYRQWLSENEEKDSTVLILGSSAFETMALRNKASLKGKGSRVLLFESNLAVEGISTLIISRYGVSYLAGAMSQRIDAFILAAKKGHPTLEESIKGFQDARELYAGEYQGDPCTTTLQYLVDSGEGFAMPELAYRAVMQRADQDVLYNEIIFPLLGGSEAGVLRFINDEEYTLALMIGMDVNRAGQSSRIPFSVVIRIGDVLKQYLENWLGGQEWPAHQRLGMKDGVADIAITPNFSEHLLLYEDRGYRVPDWFKWRYNDYKAEAEEKEASYGK